MRTKWSFTLQQVLSGKAFWPAGHYFQCWEKSNSQDLHHKDQEEQRDWKGPWISHAVEQRGCYCCEEIKELQVCIHLREPTVMENDFTTMLRLPVWISILLGHWSIFPSIWTKLHECKPWGWVSLRREKRIVGTNVPELKVYTAKMIQLWTFNHPEWLA